MLEKHRVACGDAFMAALRPDGRVIAYGFLADERLVEAWSDIVSLWADGEALIGLDAGGRLLGAGQFSPGRYGPRPVAERGLDRLARVVSAEVSAGEVYALDEYGRLFRLDLRDGRLSTTTPEKAAERIGCFKRSVHMVPGPGGTFSGLDEAWRAVATGWTDVVEAAFGRLFAIGLRRDGTLVTAGGVYPALMDGQEVMNRRLLAREPGYARKEEP